MTHQHQTFSDYAQLHEKGFMTRVPSDQALVHPFALPPDTWKGHAHKGRKTHLRGSFARRKGVCGLYPRINVYIFRLHEFIMSAYSPYFSACPNCVAWLNEELRQAGCPARVSPNK